ncbi:hemolysin family protein [Thermus thermamylovorans]|uniref:HlyC/CorC family transporter n=1 Tax=Thermus thermamylovorans TaxID=2509362 RepID=A0A4Q9B7D4_9DEIN|nr:hemolysin family protein [Thermus thermamylovorans]TBH21022.1 HlyC/CorC family transporter [Thermus thermamylovorans]
MDRPPSRWLFLLPFGSLALAQSQTPSPLDLALLLFLLGLSAFFSASETAFTTLYPWKAKELSETQGGPFRLLAGDITRFLTTILVGNNLVNIAATALVTDLAIRAFGSVGVGLATGVMTFLILFFGEITPKSIAVHHAVGLARLAVWPVYLLSVVLYPLGRLFGLVSGGLLRLLRLEPRNTPLVSEQELRLILAGAEASGAIEAQEEEMIHSILELEETPVREIMTPRVEMVALEAGATLEDFLHLFREHRYSRVPVYRESVDHIVGVAYAKDLLDFHCEEDLKGRTVASIAHPPYFVPENMDAWTLLRELRRRKVHLAIVVDEFGGTAGLVTLEDVMEEIVGEIYDETDEPEDLPIRRLPDGAFSIQAQTPVDEVSEALGVELPEGEYDTLSGFLYERFGRIPGVGESVEWQGFRFVVESADQRRIERVRVERLVEHGEG